jgi:hypothetical protein
MQMQMLLNKYKWPVIASIFSALTLISVSYVSNSDANTYSWLLVTVLSETGLIYSYLQMLQTHDIISGFSVVKILSILIALLPSVVFLGVELTNKKIVGLLFAFIAIYLLV